MERLKAKIRNIPDFPTPGIQFKDITPLLAAADLLVTDHSTVGFEFALLDRPLIVFDAPDLRAAARIDGSSGRSSDRWRTS